MLVQDTKAILIHIKMNKKHKRGKNTKEERKIKRRNKKMRITKREKRKNTRNNTSSFSCHTNAVNLRKFGCFLST